MWLPSLSDQFPCESAVLLPGCGLAPFDTSLPGLPLLSPGTPLTLSGAMRCSSSSIGNSFIRFTSRALRVPNCGLGPPARVREADGSPAASLRLAHIPLTVEPADSRGPPAPQSLGRRTP